jgi:hypothetical protein
MLKRYVTHSLDYEGGTCKEKDYDIHRLYDDLRGGIGSASLNVYIRYVTPNNRYGKILRYVIDGQFCNNIMFKDTIFCFPQRQQIYKRTIDKGWTYFYDEPDFYVEPDFSKPSYFDFVGVRVLDKNDESFEGVKVSNYIKKENVIDNKYDVCDDKDIIFYDDVIISEFVIVCDDEYAYMYYKENDIYRMCKLRLSKILDILKDETTMCVCDPNIIRLDKNKSIRIYRTNVVDTKKMRKTLHNCVCLCDEQDTNIIFKTSLKLYENFP